MIIDDTYVVARCQNPRHSAQTNTMLVAIQLFCRSPLAWLDVQHCTGHTFLSQHVDNKYICDKRIK